MRLNAHNFFFFFFVFATVILCHVNYVEAFAFLSVLTRLSNFSVCQIFAISIINRSVNGSIAHLLYFGVKMLKFRKKKKFLKHLKIFKAYSLV